MFIAGVYVWNERTQAQQQKATDSNWSLIGRAISEKDHTLGKIDAPVQVIVYSDFECVHCTSLFLSVLPRLQKNFTDKIVVAYRHYPLPNQPGAALEAEASECVYNQAGNDGFWRFVDMMYARPVSQKKENLEALSADAARLGLDAKLFAVCIQRGDAKGRIAADMSEASIAGMQFTPSILLKSTHRALIVEGDYYSKLSTGVEYLLDAEAQIQKAQ